MITPGKETTEYKLTQLGVWLGIGLTAVSGMNETLEAVRNVTGENKIIDRTTMYLGVATILISKAIYIFNRISLKKKELDSQAVPMKNISIT